MNLQFAQNQSSEAAVVVTRQDGTVIFAYDPSDDEVLAENSRVYSGAVISCANFYVGETYYVYVDGVLTGTDYSGIYDPTSVTAYEGGIQMAYTGTDVMSRPGGMGFGGEPPKDFDPDNLPEGFDPDKRPEDMQMGDRSEMPEGFDPNQMPENFQPGQMPENFQPGQMPEGMTFPGGQTAEAGEPNSRFYMQDKVNFFSGLQKA